MKGSIVTAEFSLAKLTVMLYFLVLAMPSWTQTPLAAVGNKGVWQSSTSLYPSTAWIDASASWTSTADMCQVIYNILNGASYPSTGAVIDARGFYNNTGLIACSVNPFPTLSSLPSTTVLLPSGTISISDQWVVPNNTRIVGEGRNTVLQAAAGLTGYMIEMGGSMVCPSSVCSSVGIDHIHLDGHLANVGGIENTWSQSSTYIDNVNLGMISGTGLHVNAPNSGPYTNIAFSANAGSATVPICIRIDSPTQGIHGVTCTSGNPNTGSGGDAAIYINASNNSIEDIHTEGFYDGVEVGNASSPVSNILVSNFTVSNGSGNVVHICGPVTPSGFHACLTPGTVTDITILGAANFSPSSGGAAVLDDVTQTAIEGCAACSAPLNMAFYVLGEQISGSPTVPAVPDYTRFTTSPANGSTANYGTLSSLVPAWATGTVAISGGTPCTNVGALYSYPATSGSSVFTCTYSGWQSIP